MSRRRRGQQRYVQKPYVDPIDYSVLAGELVKAMNLPAGARGSSLVAQATAAGTSAPRGATYVPINQNAGVMPWVDPMVAFGPGMPIRPAAIDPVDPITGRLAPRRYEYNISTNLNTAEDRTLPWTLLRRLADQSIVRRCIEIRKAEMVAQEWDISVSTMALQRAMAEKASTTSEQEASARAQSGDPEAIATQARTQRISMRSSERTLRQKNADLITSVKEFWQMPDKGNGLTFDDWLMMALEEHFVLDALSIYPRLSLGGQLHSLEIIDGSTIKPLIDHRGGTPQPPNPAYQQILHGFPRGEYGASLDFDDEFDVNALIYRPRVRRANSPYGMSNVEQAIVNADLYMKRIEWIRAEYTAGVIPEMYIELDVNLTPDQITAYERVFNNMLSGQAEERHRAKIFPNGFKVNQLQNFEERYRPDYDLHLIRLIGNDFDVMPTELGFPPNGGLGGKGVSDAEENTTFRKGSRPLTKWAVDTFNLISRRYLHMTDELTFKFLGLESEDEGMAQDIMEAQFHNAAITANEMRDELGLSRYDIADADMPFIITGRDIVPLQGSFDRAQAAALAAVQPPGGTTVPGGAGKKSDVGAATAPSDSGAPETPKAKVVSDDGDNSGNAFKQKGVEADWNEEISLFKSYVKNRQKTGRPWRDFDFRQVGNAQALRLNQVAALSLVAGLAEAEKEDMMGGDQQ